jgi:hypothetical protein
MDVIKKPEKPDLFPGLRKAKPEVKDTKPKKSEEELPPNVKKFHERIDGFNQQLLQDDNWGVPGSYDPSSKNEKETAKPTFKTMHKKPLGNNQRNRLDRPTSSLPLIKAQPPQTTKNVKVTVK